MRGCSCPRDGTYLCPWCQALATRADPRTVLRWTAEPVSQAPPDEPEHAFQAWLYTTARRLGWEYWHDNDSRGNAPGLPDTLLAKAGAPLLLWELKVGARKVTQAQQTWIALANHATGVQGAVWYPRDKGTMEAILARPPLP